MKCVCLYTSPRKKGNSAALAERFAQTVQNRGTEVQTFYLNELNFKGCQACFACKQEKDHCVLPDDLQQVLEAIRDSDCLVVASPIYFGDLCSQAKAFIDRSFSFLRPDFKTSSQPGRLTGNKHLVFILTQGQPDEEVFKDVYPKYAQFLKWEGFGQTHLIRGCGLMAPDDASKNQELLNQVDMLAEEIVNG